VLQANAIKAHNFWNLENIYDLTQRMLYVNFTSTAGPEIDGVGRIEPIMEVL